MLFKEAILHPDISLKAKKVKDQAHRIYLENSMMSLTSFSVAGTK